MVFSLRLDFPTGSVEHCLAVCLHFFASYRLSSLTMWSNRIQILLFSVPAIVKGRQQTDSRNARSRRTQNLLFSVPATVKRRQQTVSSIARSKCTQKLLISLSAVCKSNSNALITSEADVQDRLFLSADESSAAHAQTYILTASKS